MRAQRRGEARAPTWTGRGPQGASPRCPRPRDTHPVAHTRPSTAACTRHSPPSAGRRSSGACVPTDAWYLSTLPVSCTAWNARRPCTDVRARWRPQHSLCRNPTNPTAVNVVAGCPCLGSRHPQFPSGLPLDGGRNGKPKALRYSDFKEQARAFPTKRCSRALDLGLKGCHAVAGATANQRRWGALITRSRRRVRTTR